MIGVHTIVDGEGSCSACGTARVHIGVVMQPVRGTLLANTELSLCFDCTDALRAHLEAFVKTDRTVTQQISSPPWSQLEWKCAGCFQLFGHTDACAVGDIEAVIPKLYCTRCALARGLTVDPDSVPRSADVVITHVGLTERGPELGGYVKPRKR